MKAKMYLPGRLEFTFYFGEVTSRLASAWKDIILKSMVNFVLLLLHRWRLFVGIGSIGDRMYQVWYIFCEYLRSLLGFPSSSCSTLSCLCAGVVYVCHLCSERVHTRNLKPVHTYTT